MEAEEGKHFYSVNKFWDFIGTKHDNVYAIHLWFAPMDSFKNEYKQVCIKPIAMMVKGDDGSKKVYKYEEFVKLCGNEVIISFAPTFSRTVNKKVSLQILTIYKKVKEFKSYGSFHLSDIVSETNKQVIKVLNDAVKDDVCNEICSDVNDFV